MTYILLYRGVREGSTRQVYSAGTTGELKEFAKKQMRRLGHHARGYTYYPYEERKPLFE